MSAAWPLRRMETPSHLRPKTSVSLFSTPRRGRCGRRWRRTANLPKSCSTLMARAWRCRIGTALSRSMIPPPGSEIAVLTNHTMWVASLAFSRPAPILATSSADQRIRLWDTRTWKDIRSGRDVALRLVEKNVASLLRFDAPAVHTNIILFGIGLHAGSSTVCPFTLTPPSRISCSAARRDDTPAPDRIFCNLTCTAIQTSASDLAALVPSVFTSNNHHDKTSTALGGNRCYDDASWCFRRFSCAPIPCMTKWWVLDGLLIASWLALIASWLASIFENPASIFVASGATASLIAACSPPS